MHSLGFFVAVYASETVCVGGEVAICLRQEDTVCKSIFPLQAPKREFSCSFVRPAQPISIIVSRESGSCTPVALIFSALAKKPLMQVAIDWFVRLYETRFLY